MGNANDRGGHLDSGEAPKKGISALGKKLGVPAAALIAVMASTDAKAGIVCGNDFDADYGTQYTPAGGAADLIGVAPHTITGEGFRAVASTGAVQHTTDGINFTDIRSDIEIAVTAAGHTWDGALVVLQDYRPSSDELMINDVLSFDGVYVLGGFGATGSFNSVKKLEDASGGVGSIDESTGRYFGTSNAFGEAQIVEIFEGAPAVPFYEYSNHDIYDGQVDLANNQGAVHDSDAGGAIYWVEGITNVNPTEIDTGINGAVYGMYSALETGDKDMILVQNSDTGAFEYCYDDATGLPPEDVTDPTVSGTDGSLNSVPNGGTLPLDLNLSESTTVIVTGLDNVDTDLDISVGGMGGTVVETVLNPNSSSFAITPNGLGITNWTFTVSDDAGNQSVYEVNVDASDNTPPVITGLVDGSEVYHNVYDGNYQVVFSVTDAVDSDPSATATLTTPSGAEFGLPLIENPDQTFTAVVVSSEVGQHTLDITGEDEAGGQASVQVFVDIDYPTAAGALEAGNIYLMNGGTVIPNVEGIEVNGGTLTVTVEAGNDNDALVALQDVANLLVDVEGTGITAELTGTGTIGRETGVLAASTSARSSAINLSDVLASDGDLPVAVIKDALNGPVIGEIDGELILLEDGAIGDVVQASDFHAASVEGDADTDTDTDSDTDTDADTDADTDTDTEHPGTETPGSGGSTGCDTSGNVNTGWVLGAAAMAAAGLTRRRREEKE